ncbi:MAG: hypothetical protein Q9M09_01380 [Mariprofundaceae bacterium]|nr:hypothetical protein [Mariprofundaceae bacterium]
MLCFLRLDSEQKSCAILVGYLLRVALPDYVYRGTNETPQTIRDNKGFIARDLDGNKSILKHCCSTRKSIYISTTTVLEEAVRHAQKAGKGWVYKIKSKDGILVSDFLELCSGYHKDEKEVVFPCKIPLGNVECFQIAFFTSQNKSTTDKFFPILERPH